MTQSAEQPSTVNNEGASQRIFVNFSFAVDVTVASMSTYAKAQRVEVNALSSPGLFLELGLGASSSTEPIKATCVRSENTSTVIAIDSNAGSALTDKGMRGWRGRLAAAVPAARRQHLENVIRAPLSSTL